MAVAHLSVPVQVRVTVGSDVVDLEDWELFTVLRRKNGLTQGDVAERAGVSQPTMSRWERGHLGSDDPRAADLWAALMRLCSERADGTAA